MRPDRRALRSRSVVRREPAREPDQNVLPTPRNAFDHAAGGERLDIFGSLWQSDPPPFDMGGNQRGANRGFSQSTADGFDFR